MGREEGAGERGSDQRSTGKKKNKRGKAEKRGRGEERVNGRKSVRCTGEEERRTPPGDGRVPKEWLTWHDFRQEETGTKVWKETLSNHHEARHRCGAREHEGGGGFGREKKGTKPEECGEEERRSLERRDGAEGVRGATEGRALGLRLVGMLGSV